LSQLKHFSEETISRFSGFDDPPEWAVQRSVEFLINSKAGWALGSSRNGLLSKRSKLKNMPRASRDGTGLDWLKMFRDYTGDECLLFPLRTGACPRGRVTYNFKNMEAHRAMCLLVHKLPPEGKPMALHRCGNGHLGCVNPNHLYWGDQSDNNRDAHRHAKEGKQAA
jgi:hypothetical protein